MILIIKFLNSSTTIFDTLADNGIPQPYDALLVRHVLKGGTLLFSIDTDKAGGVANRRAGEFSLTFSLLQTTTSYLGETLNNFFRGGSRDYKYWVAVQEGSTVFHGVYDSANLESDLTTSQGHCEVSFFARDTVEEFAKYLETLNSQFAITESFTSTFEHYIENYHLRGLKVNFRGTLSEKVGRSVYFSGYNYVRGISAGTDVRSISRLESFKELSKGLGFIYYLTVNKDLEQLYNNGPAGWYPRSFMDINIEWLWDGTFVYSNDMTITATTIHKEKTLSRPKPYLFLGYRHIISTTFPGFDEIDFTAVRGILTDGVTTWESDSIDNINPIYAHYPFFYFPPSGGTAPDGNWISDEQFAFYNRRYPYPEKPPIFNYSEVNFVELTLYNYTSLGGSSTPGSCTYSRLFTTGDGFAPIQRFVINQYQRYILGLGKKVKDLEIPIESNTQLNVYKPVRLTDDQGEGIYYISKIKDLDLANRRVGLELTQI